MNTGDLYSLYIGRLLISNSITLKDEGWSGRMLFNILGHFWICDLVLGTSLEKPWRYYCSMMALFSSSPFSSSIVHLVYHFQLAPASGIYCSDLLKAPYFLPPFITPTPICLHFLLFFFIVCLSVSLAWE